MRNIYYWVGRIDCCSLPLRRCFPMADAPVLRPPMGPVSLQPTDDVLQLAEMMNIPVRAFKITTLNYENVPEPVRRFTLRFLEAQYYRNAMGIQEVLRQYLEYHRSCPSPLRRDASHDPDTCWECQRGFPALEQALRDLARRQAILRAWLARHLERMPAYRFAHPHLPDLLRHEDLDLRPDLQIQVSGYLAIHPN